MSEADRRYTIRDPTRSNESARTGKELQEGGAIPVEPGVEVRLILAP